MSQVIYIFVAHDQTCEVPSRYIGENVALLRDVATRANELNLFVATLSLDQEKAIDRVDCSFLLRTLLSMGFSPSLISWVKRLYADIRSSILVDGYVSPSLKPPRGAGCAVRLSSVAFALCAHHGGVGHL